jgi:hydrogenase maturation protease
VLVLCLGNDLRRDDGVGWRVAERLEETPPGGAVIRKSAASGLYLLDEMAGFDRLVVVDAVRTGRHATGDVFSCEIEDLDVPPGPSPHAVGLSTVLRVGRRCGLAMPRQVTVVAIEAADMETVGMGLTPRVESAVSRACDLVRSIVEDAARQRRNQAPGVSPGSARIADRTKPRA